MSYVSNHKASITADGGTFLIEQRNVGFADNDGRWIVSQLAELYWSNIGTMRQRRPGAFLGVFDDMDAVNAAIAAAAPQPERDEMVMSMGRVSC
jgi:hypothetical protein